MDFAELSRSGRELTRLQRLLSMVLQRCETLAKTRQAIQPRKGTTGEIDFETDRNGCGVAGDPIYGLQPADAADPRL